MLNQRQGSGFQFSQEQVETFVDAMPFCLGYAGQDQRIILANRVAEEWFGEPRAELYGKSIKDILELRRYQLIEPYIRQALAGETVTFQLTVDLVGGQIIDAQSTYTPDVGQDGSVRGFFFMGVDISSRRRVEEELLRSQQVLEVITREQQRISRDLHDTVGQDLTGLSFMTKKLVQKLEAKNLPEAESAGRIAEGIKRAISTVRKAIKGVVPVEVESNGLMVALEHLAFRTRERYAIDCHFECARPVEVQNRDRATELYRIAQEAVNNAVKHGQASRILIKLEADMNETRISVQNDGLAIEDDVDVEASGIGVRIMHFRAGVIGARLAILPLEEGGTVVTCILPRE